MVWTKRSHVPGTRCERNVTRRASRTGGSAGSIPRPCNRRELARLSGKPQWIEERGGEAVKGAGSRILAVVEKSRWVERAGYKGLAPYSMIQDLASGKLVSLEERARRSFRIARVDYGWALTRASGAAGARSSIQQQARSAPSRAGRSTSTNPTRNTGLGVFGFFERHDGQVWALGGTTHMGFTERVHLAGRSGKSRRALLP